MRAGILIYLFMSRH